MICFVCFPLQVDEAVCSNKCIFVGIERHMLLTHWCCYTGPNGRNVSIHWQNVISKGFYLKPKVSGSLKPTVGYSEVKCLVIGRLTEIAPPKVLIMQIK